jgi:hypothetical protein
MIRRWLIRAPCLLPLLLVVGLWITSYFGGLQIGGGFWHRQFLFMSVEGMGGLEVQKQSSSSIYFCFLPGLTAQNWFWREVTPQFWGGRFWTFYDGFGCTFLFRFSLPTLLLAALNWLVWRKTRPAYNGRGFPVEVAAKGKVP